MWITGTYDFLSLDGRNWYQIFTNVGTKSSNVWRISGLSPHICEKMLSNRHMRKNLYNTLTCEEQVPILQTCEILVQNYHRYDELVLNCKIWQWQNCEELESNVKYIRVWGILSTHREEYACMLYEVWLCAFHKVRYWYGYVAYWYQFFTCMWDITNKNSTLLHSVNFTKCEFCGSIKPFVPRFQNP